MNETIAMLNRRRSIRKYKPDPIPEETFRAIMQAAQRAPTSSNMQAYSAIAVTDPDKKAKLAELAGNQAYVAECPVFLVWCADLHRLKAACEPVGGVALQANTELFLIASVDAALAAQTATVAAESLGLGTVYIGGIRNHPQQVSELLGLPDLVYPVVGLCLGWPAEEPTQRPRLPLQAVLHRERYSDASYPDSIAEYNDRLRHYMLTRTGGRRDTTWSKEMMNRLRAKPRPHLKPFLEGRGFRLE